MISLKAYFFVVPPWVEVVAGAFAVPPVLLVVPEPLDTPPWIVVEAGFFATPPLLTVALGSTTARRYFFLESRLALRSPSLIAPL